MSLNSLKKMMIFSSEKNKKIIENMVSDESKVQNQSSSGVIELYLLNNLLPKNKDASNWVRFLYDESWDINDVLEAVFSYLAVGVNWEARYDNGFEIVEYASKLEQKNKNRFNKKSGEMNYFLSQFDSVVQKMQLVAEKAGNNKVEAKNEAEDLATLYDTLRNNSQEVSFEEIYFYILYNWEVLKNWTITYRLLMSLVRMQKKWDNTEEERYVLVQKLKHVSNKWN